MDCSHVMHGIISAGVGYCVQKELLQVVMDSDVNRVVELCKKEVKLDEIDGEELVDFMK